MRVFISQKITYLKSQKMVVLPLQEHIVEKIAMMEDGLLLNMLERHYWCGNMSLKQVDLAYNSAKAVMLTK